MRKSPRASRKPPRRPAPRGSRARGRPRAFDPDEALDRALEVFWRKGYETASMEDLTGAMGIHRPSLYAAFGNKEALYRKALDRYGERSAHFLEALREPTARGVAERLLRAAAEVQTGRSHPRGCFMVQALSSGGAAEKVRKEICSRREEQEAALRRRLERARLEGDLPRGAEPADLALFLVAVIHGMAVQAAGGASRSSLRRIAETALRAWP
jgi:AcrR family transcriptional regulator